MSGSRGAMVGHKEISTARSNVVNSALIENVSLMTRLNFSMCNYFVGNRRFWDTYLSFFHECLAKLKSQPQNSSLSILDTPPNYQKNQSTSLSVIVIEGLFSSFLCTQTQLKVSAFQCE